MVSIAFGYKIHEVKCQKSETEHPVHVNHEEIKYFLYNNSKKLLVHKINQKITLYASYFFLLLLLN